VVQIIEHWMISEKRIEKDVEGSSSVIIWGIMMASAW
jgi:hypothetical protein